MQNSKEHILKNVFHCSTLNNNTINLRETGCTDGKWMEGISSKSCPMVGFGISGVQPSGYTSRFGF
jgi:hypothetical protein